MKRSALTRACAAGLGALLLTGVAATAAAEENHGEDGVDVTVEITDITPPGSLSMSVAADSVTLNENGSTDEVRRFTGKLPEVTITDSRDPDDIPDGAFWYVLGSASDFTSGANTITAGHLGWAPELTDESESGLVAAGDEVKTVLDSGANAVGLVDKELLAMAENSKDVASERSWSASADLFLKTPADAEPGTYKSTITISLFE